MADQNGKNWAERWWPYLLIAMLGGTGGAGFKDVLMPPRPDPFTGRAAGEMQHRLDKEFDDIHKRLERMDTRYLALTALVAKLPPDDLVKQVTVLEEQVKNLRRAYEVKGYPE